MNERSIRHLLERVASGQQGIDDALAALKGLPFEDLGYARLDHHRSLRSGFPEVIYCQGKTPHQLAEIVSRLAASNPPGPRHARIARAV